MSSPRSSDIPLRDRYLGALFGLAVGDAVGTTLEFRPRGSFVPISDMCGGGPFDQQKGQWTDDTSMALCLAESLIQCGGFDAADQMNRYVRWWQNGHLSSTGSCFDIGGTTRAALEVFQETENPMAGSSHPRTAGNGSLMRLTPIPLAYAHDAVAAVNFAAMSSKTTHAAVEAVDACRFMALLIVLAIHGASKELLLHKSTWKNAFPSRSDALAPNIDQIARGSYKTKTESQISGSGYVVDCLEAALWSFYRTDNYKDAILTAANLGDDADTTAAVCGQLAGAFYGIDGIPPQWVKEIALRETIEQFAEGLLKLSADLGRI
jgi:ADP-ribosyl-[dinitrogen reductase] hydrolase